MLTWIQTLPNYTAYGTPLYFIYLIVADPAPVDRTLLRQAFLLVRSPDLLYLHLLDV